MGGRVLGGGDQPIYFTCEVKRIMKKAAQDPVDQSRSLVRKYLGKEGVVTQAQKKDMAGMIIAANGDLFLAQCTFEMHIQKFKNQYKQGRWKTKNMMLKDRNGDNDEVNKIICNLKAKFPHFVKVDPLSERECFFDVTEIEESGTKGSWDINAKGDAHDVPLGQVQALLPDMHIPQTSTLTPNQDAVMAPVQDVAIAACSSSEAGSGSDAESDSSTSDSAASDSKSGSDSEIA